jgi:hypothetical protein
VTPSRRLGKTLLGVAISVALLVSFFWNADFRSIGARLAETHWGFLALACVLNVSSLAARAWRWHYLFPPGSRPRRLLSAVMIGYMGNNLLPLRAGEIVRAWIAARRGQRFWTTVATMVVERVLDASVICLMLAALFLVMPVRRELQWAALAFLSVDLALIVALAVLAVTPGWCRRQVRALCRRWPRLERRLDALVATFNEGLEGIRTGRHFPPIAAGTALIWLLVALAVWSGFRSARLELPFGATWAVIAFLGLGVSLPSSPGFAGVVQAACVLALDLFAVPRTDSLSFSILLQFVIFVPVTALGLGLLLVEGVTFADIAGSVRDRPRPPL